MEQQSNVSDFAGRLKKENLKYDKEMIQHRQRAKTEAERLAGILISEIPEIKQIWGFGSVFENHRPFTKASDIDLALEGGNYFAAYKIVERSPFRVDLIDITYKRDKFSSLIRKHGTALL